MFVKNKVHARALIYFVEGETTQRDFWVAATFCPNLDLKASYQK